MYSHDILWLSSFFSFWLNLSFLRCIKIVCKFPFLWLVLLIKFLWLQESSILNFLFFDSKCSLANIICNGTSDFIVRKLLEFRVYQHEGWRYSIVVFLKNLLAFFQANVVDDMVISIIIPLLEWIACLKRCNVYHMNTDLLLWILVFFLGRHHHHISFRVLEAGG